MSWDGLGKCCKKGIYNTVPRCCKYGLSRSPEGWVTLKIREREQVLLLPPTLSRKKKKGFTKKNKNLQLSNTRQLSESSSPKLFFFSFPPPWAKWMLQAVTVLMVFFSRRFPLLPELKAELQRLQETLHAITSQAGRWQLRQGLMRADIIECGLQQSSCLEPLLIVAVIRWSFLP